LSVKVAAGGPRISNVKESSAMAGILRPGDVIVAVGDVDTRNMTTQEVQDLLAKVISISFCSGEFCLLPLFLSFAAHFSSLIGCLSFLDRGRGEGHHY